MGGFRQSCFEGRVDLVGGVDHVAGEYVFGHLQFLFKLCALAPLRATMFVSPKQNRTQGDNNRK